MSDDRETCDCDANRPARRFEELTASQVMALAIGIEKGNARRFRTFADVFAGYDDVVASRFRELADEEDLHERTLVQEYRRRFGDEPIPAVDEGDVDVVIEAFDLDDAEHQIFDAMEPIRVYELALRAEQLAHSFYDRAATACADRDLLDVYRRLADMEDDHVGWFEARIADARNADARKKGV